MQFRNGAINWTILVLSSSFGEALFPVSTMDFKTESLSSRSIGLWCAISKTPAQSTFLTYSIDNGHRIDHRICFHIAIISHSRVACNADRPFHRHGTFSNFSRYSRTLCVRHQAPRSTYFPKMVGQPRSIVHHRRLSLCRSNSRKDMARKV